jgi:hypothetical protein
VLEKRGLGLVLGYRPNSIEGILIGSHSPPLWSPSPVLQKFLVNFQGFQADVSTEEDFFSCQQYERETLTDFFCRFLRLKAQAPEVSDEQAIT